MTWYLILILNLGPGSSYTVVEKFATEASCINAGETLLPQLTPDPEFKRFQCVRLPRW